MNSSECGSKFWREEPSFCKIAYDKPRVSSAARTVLSMLCVLWMWRWSNMTSRQCCWRTVSRRSVAWWRRRRSTTSNDAVQPRTAFIASVWMTPFLESESVYQRWRSCRERPRGTPIPRPKRHRIRSWSAEQNSLNLRQRCGLLRHPRLSRNFT